MNDTDDLIQLADYATPRLIKVIGVGGGGSNAVAQMYNDNIPEVRCVVANTDKKALEDNVVPDHLQMGPGLGAGGNPERGRKLAEESINEIKHELDDETKMVFITAGMGNGTGTGASPIIAREARKKGILTIGIVTIPFRFEGKVRIDKALDGLEILANEVDAMLVINNERLLEIYSDLSVLNAFRCADKTLSVAVRSITEIISMHGRINLDFQDVRNTLTNGGVAIMSTGYGEGTGRVTKAIQAAINSPLINHKNIFDATHLLLAITTSDESGNALLTSELEEVRDFIDKFNTDVETKWGFALDRSLGSKIKVTIIASGFGIYGRRPATKSQTETDGYQRTKEQEARAKNFYPQGKRHKKRHPHIYLFSTDDLYNHELIKHVDALPTHTRTLDELNSIKELSTNNKDNNHHEPL